MNSPKPSGSSDMYSATVYVLCWLPSLHSPIMFLWPGLDMYSPLLGLNEQISFSKKFWFSTLAPLSADKSYPCCDLPCTCILLPSLLTSFIPHSTKPSRSSDPPGTYILLPSILCWLHSLPSHLGNSYSCCSPISFLPDMYSATISILCWLHLFRPLPSHLGNSYSCHLLIRLQSLRSTCGINDLSRSIITNIWYLSLESCTVVSNKSGSRVSLVVILRKPEEEGLAGLCESETVSIAAGASQADVRQLCAVPRRQSVSRRWLGSETDYGTNLYAMYRESFHLLSTRGRAEWTDVKIGGVTRTKALLCFVQQCWEKLERVQIYLFILLPIKPNISGDGKGEYDNKFF